MPVSDEGFLYVIQAHKLGVGSDCYGNCNLVVRLSIEYLADMNAEEIVKQVRREIKFLSSNPGMDPGVHAEHGEIASRLLDDLLKLISHGS